MPELTKKLAKIPGQMLELVSYQSVIVFMTLARTVFSVDVGSDEGPYCTRLSRDGTRSVPAR